MGRFDRPEPIWYCKPGRFGTVDEHPGHPESMRKLVFGTPAGWVFVDSGRYAAGNIAILLLPEMDFQLTGTGITFSSKPVVRQPVVPVEIVHGPR